MLIVSTKKTDIDALLLLGFSTSRGDAETIGEFGTGFKYAIAQALRMGYVLTAYVDGVKYPITEVQTVVNGETVGVVYFGRHKTGFTTQLGCQHWTDPWFIVRELVCNAADAMKCHPMLCRGTKVPHTGVAIELPDELSRYYTEAYFTTANYGVVSDRPGHVYKKNVFVGKFNTLFGYNFEYLSLNESRTASESDVRYSIDEYWNSTDCDPCLRKVIGSKDMLEHRLTSMRRGDHNKLCEEMLQKSQVFAPTSMMWSEDNVKSQGYTPVYVPTDWFAYACRRELPSIKDLGVKQVMFPYDVVEENHVPACMDALWRMVEPIGRVPKITLVRWHDGTTYRCVMVDGVVFMGEKTPTSVLGRKVLEGSLFCRGCNVYDFTSVYVEAFTKGK